MVTLRNDLEIKTTQLKTNVEPISKKYETSLHNGEMSSEVKLKHPIENDDTNNENSNEEAHRQSQQ